MKGGYRGTQEGFTGRERKFPGIGRIIARWVYFTPNEIPPKAVTIGKNIPFHKLGRFFTSSQPSHCRCEDWVAGRVKNFESW